MDEVLDSRLIYTDDRITVEAYTAADDTGTRPGEFDCYSAEDVEAFKRNEWHFVTLTVHVKFEGRQIGDAALGAVESGTLGNGKECDPFAWELAQVVDGVTEVGSPLYNVTEEAVQEAWDWTRNLIGFAWPDNSSPIMRLTQLTAPHNPGLINDLHGLALRENEARDRQEVTS